ncbi:MAG: hypothetical protein KGL39_51670 [Patescibacteria group bacterium]|nr:hypothetical protein [Patescibacteria group bacterium]
MSALLVLDDANPYCTFTPKDSNKTTVEVAGEAFGANKGEACRVTPDIFSGLKSNCYCIFQQNGTVIGKFLLGSSKNPAIAMVASRFAFRIETLDGIAVPVKPKWSLALNLVIVEATASEAVNLSRVVELKTHALSYSHRVPITISISKVGQHVVMDIEGTQSIYQPPFRWVIDSKDAKAGLPAHGPIVIENELPDGYRPAKTIVREILVNGVRFGINHWGVQVGRMEITKDGNITIFPCSAFGHQNHTSFEPKQGSYFDATIVYHAKEATSSATKSVESQHAELKKDEPHDTRLERLIRLEADKTKLFQEAAQALRDAANLLLDATTWDSPNAPKVKYMAQEVLDRLADG